jgi:hypothetical protein
LRTSNAEPVVDAIDRIQSVSILIVREDFLLEERSPEINKRFISGDNPDLAYIKYFCREHKSIKFFSMVYCFTEGRVSTQV